MDGNTFRIPISLKVEKDEMYYNFIKPARDDKSLTKIITYLLRAYYDDEEIRGLVDARNAGEDALRMLNEEIDRIALEHSKSIAQVAAMKYETASIRSDITGRGTEYSTEMPANTMDNILSMLGELTEQVNRLESRMDTAGVPQIEGQSTDISSFFADLPMADDNTETDLYKAIAEEYKEGNDLDDDDIYAEKPVEVAPPPVKEKPVKAKAKKAEVVEKPVADEEQVETAKVPASFAKLSASLLKTAK